jgi:hypothetical protein
MFFDFMTLILLYEATGNVNKMTTVEDRRKLFRQKMLKIVV